MNLYFVKNTYQLLECIIHKLNETPDESAVLLINTGHVNNYPNFLDLKVFGFEKIIIYSTQNITSKETTSQEQLVDDIIEYYDNLLSGNNCSIYDFSNIYVFAALRFSIYLIEKKCSYTMFEDTPGSAATLECVLWHENTDHVNKRGLAQKYKLLDASNQYIKCFYYNKSKGELPLSTAVEYDISSKLRDMPKEALNDILHFFGESLYEGNDSTGNLIIFRHCYPYDENFRKNQNNLLKVVADWFTVDGDIVVKSHSLDDCTYQDNANVRWIKRNLPGELLPFVLGKKINKVISIASSSHTTIDNNAFQTQYLSRDIANMAHIIPKQVIVMNLLSKSGISPHNFAILGECAETTKNIIAHYFEDDFNLTCGNLNIKDSNIVFIDEFVCGENNTNYETKIRNFLSNCDDNIITVFFNPDNSIETFKVIDYQNPSALISYSISYETIDTHEIVEKESFHIWCKDASLNEKLSQFVYARVLPYSNLIARVTVI